MTYDPAWDMPKVRWQQQGSFEVGEIPPTTEPDDAPLVCLPPVNQYWLPFVMGALDQLRNPSSWIVADDDAMYNTLARVTKLREMIGGRAACAMYEIRFDGETCELQYSTDGGSTWTEVPGWPDFASCLPPQTQVALTEDCRLVQSFDGGTTFGDIAGWIEYFGSCVQDNVPVIGLPPNPGDQDKNQLACSIATFLANEIILNALSAAVTAIQDDIALLSFGASVLTIIPEFVLVKLGYDAISIIYTAVAEGTLSDYEDAIADGSLWLAVSCAIYSAIEADGLVTPGNFSAIIANVGAVSYAHPSVITAIVSYLNSLGPTGLAQLSQRAGLEVGADCTACGWCAQWDFTVSDGGWTAYDADGFDAAAYIPGTGWAQCPPPNPLSGGTQLRLVGPVGAVPETVNGISCNYQVATNGGGADRIFILFESGGITFESSSGATPPSGVKFSPAGFGGDQLWLWFNSNANADPMLITRISMTGTGTNPWPDNAC